MAAIFDDETRTAYAKRLFDHLDGQTTEQLDGIMQFSARDYTDPSLVPLERQRIFRRDPIMAAHQSELAEPNAFLNVQLPGALVLIVRQQDGSVRSFLNSCRHRGNVLTTESCGKQRVFSCSYHGWCFNSDGSLRSVSEEETFGDIDHDDFGLVEIPTEVRHGFVWLVLDPGATIDVRSALGDDFDAILSSYGLETYHTFRMKAFDQPVNWKVLLDAFLDNYHLRYAHAKSVGPYFYGNLILHEEYGQHNRSVSTRKSIDRIRDQDPSTVSLEEHVTLGHFVWPNAQLLRQPDKHFTLFTFVPHSTDVAGSRMEIRLLTAEPAETEEMVARWERNWDILMQTIVGEDLLMCRELQQAMSNDDVQPLYFGRNEVGNQIFHREYYRRMDLDPTETPVAFPE